MYSYMDEKAPRVFAAYASTLARSLRPLKFEESKHKLLSSELKHLYTALTRARSNVWIFDKSGAKRSPMFDYFTAMDLVRVESEKEAEEGEGAFSFAKESTEEDWAKQGDYFYSHEQWKLAAKCYGKAGDVKKESKGLARRFLNEAARAVEKRERVEKTVRAAYHALQGGMLKLAGECLLKAGEPLLAAEVLEKGHQVTCTRYLSFAVCLFVFVS